MVTAHVLVFLRELAVHDAYASNSAQVFAQPEPVWLCIRSIFIHTAVGKHDLLKMECSVRVLCISNNTSQLGLINCWSVNTIFFEDVGHLIRRDRADRVAFGSKGDVKESAHRPRGETENAGEGKGEGKGKACNIVPCNLCRQPMQVRTVHMQHTCAHYSAHFPHFSEATATFKLTNQSSVESSTCVSKLSGFNALTAVVENSASHSLFNSLAQPPMSSRNFSPRQLYSACTLHSAL